MYKQDLALNSLQWLIYHKIKRNIYLHFVSFYLYFNSYNLVQFNPSQTTVR